jgi:hypothetical protein
VETRRARIEFTVEGERFAIDAEGTSRGCSLVVRADGAQKEVLARVVAEAWSRGALALLDAVFARAGRSFGDAAFEYAPGEVAGDAASGDVEGGVTLRAGSATLAVDESRFVGFVLAYGRAALAAMRGAGCEPEDAPAVERRLDELRGERC